MIKSLCVACVVALSAAAAPSITITVRAGDGSPLSNVPIVQFELERYNIATQPVGQTDGHGKISLTFDDRESTRSGDRGYGVYRFFATPKNRPWALSDLYVWYPEPEKRAGYLDPSFPSFYTADNSNWRYGRRLALTNADKVDWTATLPEKRDVRIHIHDDWGLPVANAKINVFIDLCALSHTGLGGEIQVGNFATDDKGYFTLPNSGDFFYSFACYGYIAPDAYSYNNTVRRRLAAENQTLVYHRLVNLPLTFAVKHASTGDSIPNAKISQVIRFPSATQGGPIGHTDENGRFHTDTFHPEHTAWFYVSAGGFVDKQVDYVQDQSEYKAELDPQKE